MLLTSGGYALRVSGKASLTIKLHVTGNFVFPHQKRYEPHIVFGEENTTILIFVVGVFGHVCVQRLQQWWFFEMSQFEQLKLGFDLRPEVPATCR